MKITKLLAVAAITLSVVACKNDLKTTNSLTTEIDSVSYAIGLDMANKLKANYAELNTDILIQGYKNGVDSTNLLLETKDIQTTLTAYFKKQQEVKMKKQRAAQEEKAAKEFGHIKTEGEAFLAANKTKAGVKTTTSGLQYIVEKAGNGETPKITDRVKVLYKGMLKDGTVFDKNLNAKNPSEFEITQVIKGWTEGLQLMKPGAKYKFFVPQELAYGAQQRGKDIKPFSPLVFEVELVDIVKK